MKQLTRLENLIMRIGAVLILLGLVARLFHPLAGLVSFGIGAVLFALMVLRSEYQGTNFVIRRLRRQQLLGCVFLLASVVCMAFQLFRLGMFQRNEWVVSLAISAFILLYTAWRIPAELAKSNANHK